MDTFGAHAIKLMLRETQKRERILESVINERLCNSGRILPNELLHVEESNWLGRIEYRFPETNKLTAKEHQDDNTTTEGK